ncbi:MAG: Archaeosine synthase [Candidatus Methanofastidiosum methylothiophilum]|uniref:Archaeosine synthase n=1 Tax=Candidatus Methanofastidiosum methylothiophilum TaxID=1705564 RepID=A0A150IL88_9EURY|nr:MAG: Archaeosine synthase [Candidatus Methanofastidiosum methylthiophilus]KYC47627.1 MAG: Archaeosine synthase [Candidatus Methanofastidiosum methylthiophilus]KYC50244.1 MAG: Archaeosine synthase [Candidatus Methanofastidiosum methylthiophilus]
MENNLSFEILYEDGHRIGKVSINNILENTPFILQNRGDYFQFGNITIEKPISYLVAETYPRERYDLTTVPLIQIPFDIPLKEAKRISALNLSIIEDSREHCLPVYLTKYKEINQELLDYIPEKFIYFFKRIPDERILLDFFFKLKFKYPSSIFFIDCKNYEIPIFLFIGFDLFLNEENNERFFKEYMSNPEPELVEMYSNGSVDSRRLLRILYKEFYKSFEPHLRREFKRSYYIDDISLERPQVVRWRKEIEEYYKPPTNLILLLPCSAKKPYRNSKSHTKIISFLREFLKDKYPNLSQLILTSPLGVVPRELEDYADYDIPVTGHWSQEELDSLSQLLCSLLYKCSNPLIIAHFSDNSPYLNALKDMPFEISYTNGSLDELKKILEFNRSLWDKESISEYKTKAQKMFSFQFKKEYNLPFDYIERRKSTDLIFNKKNIGIFQNKIKVNVTGGEQIKDSLWVNIDFDLRGDVFSKGVISNSDNIRPGDDVIIIRNNKCVGVGEAIVSSDIMKKLKRGKVVKIRMRG